MENRTSRIPTPRCNPPLCSFPCLMHLSLPPCRASIAGGVLFCHIVTPTAWLLTPYLNHDYFPFVLISLLGLTQVWRVWEKWGAHASVDCVGEVGLMFGREVPAA